MALRPGYHEELSDLSLSQRLHIGELHSHPEPPTPRCLGYGFGQQYTARGLRRDHSHRLTGSPRQQVVQMPRRSAVLLRLPTGFRLLKSLPALLPNRFRASAHERIPSQKGRRDEYNDPFKKPTTEGNAT
jgi:hypothetical protein